MFVVAGATGRTGGVAAETLLAQGEAVRVVVRSAKKGESWRARGAEVVVASLDDAGALSRALDRAAGFFTLLPEELGAPDFHHRRRSMADSMAAAVMASGVPHVVLLSTTAASLPDGNGPAGDLHHAENALRATGAKVTAIRASSFQENVVAALPAARYEGIYPSFLPSADLALPMVATRDIGRLAARCLVEPPATSEIIDLGGPRYSARAIAEALGRAIGKQLRVVDIPGSAQVEALTRAGLPGQVAEALAELYGCMAAGRVSPQGDRQMSGTTRLDEILPDLIAAHG